MNKRLLGAAALAALALPFAAAHAQNSVPSVCMGPTIGDNVIQTPRGELLTLRPGGIADLVTLSGKCRRLGVSRANGTEAVYSDSSGVLEVRVKDGTVTFGAS